MKEKTLLLKYYFNHLNVVVLDGDALEKEFVVDQINEAIEKIDKMIHDRISRVETWTGTGKTSVNDFFNQNTACDNDLMFEIEDIVATMSFVLNYNTNTTPDTLANITVLNKLIMEEIDFLGLLSNSSKKHLLKLCHLLGHWSFPAHELTNDDLVYCVYLILSYAIKEVKRSTDLQFDPDVTFPSSNELLGLAFMVRDTYKNGNPFHNFRHAVDVLQACFHYVIRLRCLPCFKQFKHDPKADELLVLRAETALDTAVELVPVEDNELLNTSQKSNTSSTTSISAKLETKTSLSDGLVIAIQKETAVSELNSAHMNSIQTLALLIAALGHDVGHPGVTNAFMIKYAAPTSLIYNERSVLELYHSAVFINKILSINWPRILDVDIDGKTKISLKSLIISCILATDMAEHFEYIDKLAHFKADQYILDVNRVKLISSLLIKCADISNVTRPLRVSSQWALVLGREFNEVSMLEKKLSLAQPAPTLDVHYDKVPSSLPDILDANPNLHKGQIFFINTFAENLFNNIAELLPELRYTCDIIQENKEFWLSR
ncbi:uncharacterized protein AC631_02950 [Debaryomyces fabryi]|uniref:Phosphodiesterase n=1 Tax=Debaryomyces fabryi TaxID=58627 RepID=A0A0V1PYQ5_9ASCO|nr:uncharacterized protein AC631_02950 [Debaryomyces fabryi]KSA01318.1 hypothetical protein AC631_02950 [Debaryomyces fabryi]